MATFQESQQSRRKVTENLLVGLFSLVACGWLGLSLLQYGKSVYTFGAGIALVGFGAFFAWVGIKGLFHSVLTINDNWIELSGNPLDTDKRLAWSEISQATSTTIADKKMILLIASNGRIELLLQFFENSDEILKLITDHLEQNGKTLMAGKLQSA